MIHYCYISPLLLQQCYTDTLMANGTLIQFGHCYTDTLYWPLIQIRQGYITDTFGHCCADTLLANGILFSDVQLWIPVNIAHFITLLTTLCSLLRDQMHFGKHVGNSIKRGGKALWNLTLAKKTLNGSSKNPFRENCCKIYKKNYFPKLSCAKFPDVG